MLKYSILRQFDRQRVGTEASQIPQDSFNISYPREGLDTARSFFFRQRKIRRALNRHFGKALPASLVAIAFLPNSG